MNSHEGYPVLFHRHPNNPILRAKDWPYPIHTVFNCGATRFEGGVLLLCRCEDRRGISHFCVARSLNGIDDWKIDAQPTFEHQPEEYPEELWGIEDPRITYVPDLGEYVIAYTAFGRMGPGVSLAGTKDFKTFHRYGLVMQPDDKDAALLPRKYDDNFVLIHRPVTEEGANIWMSYSPNMESWGHHKLLIPARRGAWWDANKIGLSPPLIETAEGWLMMYHGVRHHASGSLYRLGLALFDLENPEVCLLRGQAWIFGPEADYEMIGDVGGVVFPCGWTIGDDGDTVNMYYGAADTCIALAQGSLREILDYLAQDGTTLTGLAGQPVERKQLSTRPLGG